MLGTVTIMTIPLETVITVAGVRCLQVQAGCVSVTLVALRAVVHPWLVVSQTDAETVRTFEY